MAVTYGLSLYTLHEFLRLFLYPNPSIITLNPNVIRTSIRTDMDEMVGLMSSEFTAISAVPPSFSLF